jgi:DNA-3-methyladenine glycosylase I
MESKNRCGWARTDIEVAYHDEEWGVPLHDDQKLFEFLVLEGAQAGLSWVTILKKREAYRKAFDQFEIAKVARYRPARVEKLLGNAGIVRNRLKIESAVENARHTLAVQKEFGSLDAYLWQFVDRQADSQRLEELEGVSGNEPAVRRDEQRHAQTRFPIRGFHHLLRLHAGGRHGQRPRSRLLPPQAGIAAELSQRLDCWRWLTLPRSC